MHGRAVFCVRTAVTKYDQPCGVAAFSAPPILGAAQGLAATRRVAISHFRQIPRGLFKNRQVLEQAQRVLGKALHTLKQGENFPKMSLMDRNMERPPLAVRCGVLISS
jgi:hypothetical protein